MAKGLSPIQAPSQICEECIIAKQHRDSFPKTSNWRANQVLKLIHSDLCGLMNPASNSNKKYFITFIDDYSRKTWVYLLTEKSEATEKFKLFKTRVEKEIGLTIQALGTDHGGEYSSVKFISMCETSGIQRQLTAVYTPQQNGVAERKNRTIMNMVRSLLLNKKMPKMFWPEAVNWSVHILNRGPTLAVKNMTLEEAWSVLKPAVVTSGYLVVWPIFMFLLQKGESLTLKKGNAYCSE